MNIASRDFQRKLLKTTHNAGTSNGIALMDFTFGVRLVNRKVFPS